MSELNQFGQPVGRALPDWQERPYPQRITLEGHYCRLEPLRQDHASDLFSAYASAEDTRGWTWLMREPETSETAYQQWVDDNCTLHDTIYFAIIDRRTARAVGVFALMRVDSKNGVIEVGHVHFSPRLSQTPMSTEAHWLLMRYVFDTLGYRRYEWKCNSLNAPSRQAAQRLGFHYEGRFRQALVVKGHNRDTDWFSIIDSEWPQVDCALRAWLAADNFTADGKQKRTLQSLRA
ncbi:GNAT family acetyltransferase [Klebsiella sp. RIT-PI-d]|uniref:GNAT family N-acetyltransferase n=1 Tax=Klebsiella sp. RIT-PI-d TaxID=1681196 RepID=UPI0006763083|nr:GNAT family protein [Klebsiella sp. RIT-PI-d]KNC08549.1 GNAT family acetyltransferase [Klebsiella sp. RIT-PI-d]